MKFPRCVLFTFVNQLFVYIFQIERDVHGDHPWQQEDATSIRSPCTEVRRYAVVALTNLTFGKVTVKSFLCSFPGFIPIMVAQLSSSPTDSLLKVRFGLFGLTLAFFGIFWSIFGPFGTTLVNLVTI